jgi:hypothetical protein
VAEAEASYCLGEKKKNTKKEKKNKRQEGKREMGINPFLFP